MASGPTALTPLTPVGALLRPLPERPLEAALQRLADRLVARHPELLDRAADAGAARLRLAATDMPWQALVDLDGTRAHLTLLATDAPAPDCDAAIEGPLERLIACAGGQGDGDAMFFAREIRVTGSSELVVALRNALDDAEIDFTEEAAALAGPLAAPARAALGRAGRMYQRLAGGLDMVKADLRAPLEARLDAQAREIAELRSEVARLRRRQPRSKRTRQAAEAAPQTPSSEVESA